MIPCNLHQQETIFSSFSLSSGRTMKQQHDPEKENNRLFILQAPICKPCWILNSKIMKSIESNKF
jgi:hypothetical protein